MTKAQSIGHYIVSKKKECQKSMEFIAHLEAFYSDQQAWAELLFYQHNVKTFVISLLRKEWSFIRRKKEEEKITNKQTNHIPPRMSVPSLHYYWQSYYLFAIKGPVTTHAQTWILLTDALCQN